MTKIAFHRRRMTIPNNGMMMALEINKETIMSTFEG